MENLNRILPKGEVLPVPMLGSVTFGEPIRLEEGESKPDFLIRAREAVLKLRAVGNDELPLHMGLGQGDGALQFAVERAVLQHAGLHIALAHGQHLGGPLAATAVKQRQLVARLQAQHLHMARGVGRQGQRQAGVQGGIDMDAGTGHARECAPARAPARRTARQDRHVRHRRADQ